MAPVSFSSRPLTLVSPVPRLKTRDQTRAAEGAGLGLELTPLSKPATQTTPRQTQTQTQTQSQTDAALQPLSLSMPLSLDVTAKHGLSAAHLQTTKAMRVREGQLFWVAKGAPQVIISLAKLDEQQAAEVRFCFFLFVFCVFRLLLMCFSTQASQAVVCMAAKGLRALGVARTLPFSSSEYERMRIKETETQKQTEAEGKDEQEGKESKESKDSDEKREHLFVSLVFSRLSICAVEWRLMGLLSLLDPPRPDSGVPLSLCRSRSVSLCLILPLLCAAPTIAACRRYGLSLKMVTGDSVLIAKEVARRLGMQRVFLTPEALNKHDNEVSVCLCLFFGCCLMATVLQTDQDLIRRVALCDGFAQVRSLSLCFCVPHTLCNSFCLSGCS